MDKDRRQPNRSHVVSRDLHLKSRFFVIGIIKKSVPDPVFVEPVPILPEPGIPDPIISSQNRVRPDPGMARPGFC